MLYKPGIEEEKLCIIMNCAEYIKHLDNPMYGHEKSKSHFFIADLDNGPGGFIHYAIATVSCLTLLSIPTMFIVMASN
ncbi:hypothetical protein DWW10_17635 [Bacteroides intestinalis]|jgi:hypothetical protein|uniref:Uncharacterized protein n=1 Tax=Bacteroides intestinalis TaxID=329854 RepID=A0A412XZ97_9BACE|nr:hypothetical protein DWW10_17635 [Bacteroides intestinalis]